MLASRKARLPRNGVLDALVRAPSTRPLRTPYQELKLSTLTKTCKSILSRPQTRGKSRHVSSYKPHPPPPPRPPPAKPSFGHILRHAVRPSEFFKGQTLRRMFRDSPEETSVALLLLLGTAGVIGYVVYLYFSYFYSTFFTRYPPDVAKSLRRALYYSNESRDDKLALKYFKLAVQQCAQHGLDPFSDEVMGIQIQMAGWLEKIEQFEPACQVLAVLLDDIKKWLDMCETTPRNLPKAPIPGTVVGEGESQRTITQQEFDHWLRSNRNRILAKSCGISTKLGELYADDHVMDKEKSHEALVWSVETSLRESRRRATEGVKEGEGDWLTPEEIGGALESLAHSYERKGRFELAVPLFFQALRLCKDQCHLAVIMNNLAVAFAQHPPKAPYDNLEGIVPGEHSPPSTTSPNQPWTREQLLDAARRWAQNALSHAKEPQGEKRTPECDQACAVALVNLGDIAALAGNHTQARRWYEQGIKVSEKNDYTDGVKQAQAGLAKLAQ